MAKLALCGGNAIRSDPYPAWPQGGAEENIWLEKVLASSRWFAGLQGDDPNALGTLFGQRFKELHGASFALPVANGSVAIEALLEDRGYEVFAFHSNGTGGKAMEELAVEGLLDALFDLSTHELLTRSLAESMQEIPNVFWQGV